MKQGSIQLAALYVEQASIQQTLQYRCVVVGSEHPEAVTGEDLHEGEGEQEHSSAMASAAEGT